MAEYLGKSEQQKKRAYSPAVITQGGKTVWLAGQTATVDEQGNDISGNFEAQVKTIFSLLDKTLIVITTEFGRPPEFDGGGGRGHQGSAFTCVLAGGGLRHCGAWGETDDIAKKIVANPVSVPDFFATLCAAVGVDYTASLHDGDRPVPITDRGDWLRFASPSDRYLNKQQSNGI